MTRNRIILVALSGSLGLILGAWAFQYIGGMAPCKMCLWQRWPHWAALAFGVLALALPWRGFPLAASLGAASSGAIAIFHTGVERGWWDGPSSCTSSGDIGALSPEQLMEQIMAAPLVRCDEVPWQMFGLSMASWNAVISFALAAIWIYAATRTVNR
ncbi:MAG: disulfide bond formation protein B [Mangrovicoccus sp.]|nr:disulfide bond formation protein B [Mangrovicoccus sp.]